MRDTGLGECDARIVQRQDVRMGEAGRQTDFPHQPLLKRLLDSANRDKTIQEKRKGSSAQHTSNGM